MGLGVVFPGQGSQRVGMLAEAAAEFAALRMPLLKLAMPWLRPWACVDGPEDQLSLTNLPSPQSYSQRRTLSCAQ